MAFVPSLLCCDCLVVLSPMALLFPFAMESFMLSPCCVAHLPSSLYGCMGGRGVFVLVCSFGCWSLCLLADLACACCSSLSHLFFPSLLPVGNSPLCVDKRGTVYSVASHLEKRVVTKGADSGG